MNRYAIDVRWMVGSFRGMGRYAWQLIEPIKERTVALAPSCTDGINLKSRFEGNSFFPYWEQIMQPNLAKEEKVDYLICPYNTAPLWVSKNTKVILVVHDLIYMKSFKELPLSVSLYQTLGRLYRRFVVPRVIGKADHIITVSEYTKQEIESNYPTKSTVTVIPNAVSSEWLQHEMLPLEDRGHYFLTVAGEAPSKNLNRLIEAYSVYANSHKKPKRLKVVGIKATHHHAFQEVAKKYGVEGNVEFVGYITNEQLISMYGHAKGFIFASLFEGFGIPLIEAMATGTPIACSNTTSLPEVVGDCGYQFSPFEIDEVAKAFIYLDQPAESLSKGVSLGLERVKQYSEQQISNKFTEFWATLDEK
ncbi:glycosyltransferase family 4 protein [Vibrio alginolyticus]|uniref:glycosyltransferase family 4 protein n=1 Tax=Vibrio alginolyticus TaxID=663 RepID=UPI00215BF935|nr:glycosyltransferase family 1 protein [Vibrio alginolyticus]MCR9535733.1 glycosyltransferase family 4 protein [Vibrio alginolyticus]